MHNDVLFAELFSTRSSLFKRLAREFHQAAREFLENPSDFLNHAFTDPSLSNPRRRNLLHFGLAIALVFYASLFAAMLLFWALKSGHGIENQSRLIVVPLRPLPSLSPAEPPAAKGEEDSKGGGGGGNHQTSPATEGVAPLFDPTPSIIAPTTRPTINPPSLPVSENLLGNPELNPRRDLSMPTGLLDGAVGPPSDGPGSDNGIGTGGSGGVGGGRGRGLGDGEDGGTGGDKNNGRPGRNLDTAPKVDSLPVAMNEPRPNYTEEARAHKVQGIVRARILIGADGFVKQVRIIRGLPDGLDEEAIRAAQQMRFRPAMKSGTPVAFWMTLAVEFNLR